MLYQNVLELICSKKKWNKIKLTDDLHPDTLVLKSMIIKVNDRLIWVAPNATKQMEEFIASSNMM